MLYTSTFNRLNSFSNQYKGENTYPLSSYHTGSPADRQLRIFYHGKSIFSFKAK